MPISRMCPDCQKRADAMGRKDGSCFSDCRGAQLPLPFSDDVLAAMLVATLDTALNAPLTHPDGSLNTTDFMDSKEFDTTIQRLREEVREENLFDDWYLDHPMLF